MNLNPFSTNVIVATMTFFAYTTTQAQDTPTPPKWTHEMTEWYEPVPPVITPGEGQNPPSDAFVLFDGKDLSQWVGKGNSEPKWLVQDGIITVVKGAGVISTKKSFGDMQLHIEWRAPAEVVSKGQDRGNSGIMIQSRYELQVLDSYNNPTYVNGQAGSIYKQTAPLVNAMRKPGEWNTYDVLYTAPRFKENGALFSPGRITVLHNGIAVQYNTELKGTTPYVGLPSYKMHDKAPLTLQDHGHPVSYRNIWIREL
jgi:hypothetical protein